MSAPSEPTVSLFSTLAVKGALDLVLPAYEAESGVRVERTFAPTTVLLRDVEAGARPDVLVTVSESLDALAAGGIIDDATRTPLARAGIGVAVARGATPPDIGTLDAFVRVLLGARSVAYSRAGASGLYFAQLIEELGIAAEVNARACIIESGFTAEALLDGRADVAVQMISELLPSVPAVTLVGPFPDTAQRYTQFAAALGVHAVGQPAAGLLEALTAPAAVTAYQQAGLESL